MELEKEVKKHEEKLKQHDKELSRVNDRMAGMQRSIDEGLTRVDESNRFLREQNARQSEQNTEILQAVIKRNENSESRQAQLDKIEKEQNFQLKLLDKTNFWKAIFGIGGTAGLVIGAIIEISKIIGGK